MTNTTLKLPPISVIDDLLPNGSWKSPQSPTSLPITPPQPDQPWNSPPYHHLQFNNKNKIENDIDQVRRYFFI
jgi:hypothetical protein